MNREEYAAWVQAAWERDVLKRTPGAKASRSLRANLVQSKRAMARARRSLASRQASSRRKLNQDLADLERRSRERREASDRELDEKRWALIINSQ